MQAIQPVCARQRLNWMVVMNSIAKFLIMAAPIVVLTGAPALALDDTPANRAAQADNYLRAVPPQSLMKDIAAKMAATIPQDQRAVFVAVLTKNLDIGALAN